MTGMISKEIRKACLGQPGPLPGKSLRETDTQGTVAKGMQSPPLVAGPVSQMPMQVFFKLGRIVSGLTASGSLSLPAESLVLRAKTLSTPIDV